jgi:hypothetical protein
LHAAAVMCAAVLVVCLCAYRFFIYPGRSLLLTDLN